MQILKEDRCMESTDTLQCYYFMKKKKWENLWIYSERNLWKIKLQQNVHIMNTVYNLNDIENE